MPEKTSLKCSVEGCNGTLDMNNPICLQVGCHSFSTFFACGECGRVHNPEGEATHNRPGDEVFFINGTIEHRKPKNVADNQ